MVYRVRITRRAQRDLRAIYAYISVPRSKSAALWYWGLTEAMRSLSVSPGRCPVIPENKNLRHLLYGDKPNVYRVIFRAVERRGEVEILHIRHGARSGFSS